MPKPPQIELPSWLLCRLMSPPKIVVARVSSVLVNAAGDCEREEWNGVHCPNDDDSRLELRRERWVIGTTGDKLVSAHSWIGSNSFVLYTIIVGRLPEAVRCSFGALSVFILKMLKGSVVPSCQSLRLSGGIELDDNSEDGPC